MRSAAHLLCLLLPGGTVCTLYGRPASLPFAAESGFHSTGRVCCSFPPLLRRHVLLLSHGPRICVFDFLAGPVAGSCMALIEAGNTEEVPWRLGASFQGHGLCSTPPGSLPRALGQPCDQTWSSDTQASPCPCPATPAPG